MELLFPTNLYHTLFLLYEVLSYYYFGFDIGDIGIIVNFPEVSPIL